MLTSIKGRSVIVTGGSKGIGRGIANVFGAQGAKVLIAARNMEGAEAAAADTGIATSLAPLTAASYDPFPSSLYL